MQCQISLNRTYLGARLLGLGTDLLGLLGTRLLGRLGLLYLLSSLGLDRELVGALDLNEGLVGNSLLQGSIQSGLYDLLCAIEIRENGLALLELFDVVFNTST